MLLTRIIFSHLVPFFQFIFSSSGLLFLIPACIFISYQNFTIPRDKKKFALLMMLFFFISFINNILQPLKKTIIVYAPGAGAEVLAYLKPFAVVPASLFMMSYFLKLSERHSRDKVFYTLVCIFFSYFGLYTFLLHPFQNTFYLESFSSFLTSVLPHNLRAGPAIICYWMHTLFYVAAELWCSMVLSLLLWGLVNEISTRKEAESTYVFFTLGANLSAVVAGKISAYLSQYPLSCVSYFFDSQWEQSFTSIMLVTLACIACVLVIYQKLEESGYTPKDNYNLTKSIARKESSKKASISECLLYVIRSPHLTAIALIVISYNLVYNLSDIALNKQLEMTFGDSQQASNAFLSQVEMNKGLFSTFLALVVSNVSFRYAGWTGTALFTPVMYFISGIMFYGASIYFGYFNMPFEDPLNSFFIDPNMFILTLAGMHYSVTKAAKYSLFDATKEIAYIGLPKHDQVHGKAAIDVLASRLGKTGGSILIFTMLFFLGNDISLTVPYIFGIVMFMTFLWIVAIFRLGGFIEKQNADADSEALAELT